MSIAQCCQESFFLLCFFSFRTVVFGFPLGPWLIQYQDSGHSCSVRNEFQLMERAVNSIAEWLVSLTMVVPLLLSLSCSQVVGYRVWSWVDDYLSPLTVCRVSPFQYHECLSVEVKHLVRCQLTLSVCNEILTLAIGPSY